MRALMLALLVACAPGPSYHRPYAPISATTPHPRAVAAQKAVIAITDAGYEIESSDGGIVLSKWFVDAGYSDVANLRFRVRVVFDEGNGYEIVSQCQVNTGRDAWAECGKPAPPEQDVRPQSVLDAMGRVNAALMR